MAIFWIVSLYSLIKFALASKVLAAATIRANAKSTRRKKPENSHL
jgi:hypothetical protein